MKVGDYVRTNNGGVGKIIKCPFKSMYLDEIWGDIENTETIITNNVYKSSPNIIDLIEVGDYVNGERVVYIDDCKGAMREFYYTFEDVTHDVGHYEEEIETIVTKERFESMEYKLGVDNDERRRL